jgi:hypothetical protein
MFSILSSPIKYFLVKGKYEALKCKNNYISKQQLCFVHTTVKIDNLDNVTSVLKICSQQALSPPSLSLSQFLLI